MARLRRALDAGWDPVELREQYKPSVAEKRSAKAALAAVPRERGVSRQELEAIISGSEMWLRLSTEPNLSTLQSCTPRCDYR